MAIRIFITLCFLFFCVDAYSDNNNFKVGVIIAQTGPAAKYGRFAVMGLQLALEEINNSGGVNGKKLELVIEDSQTQANQAVTAYNKLANFDHVKVIIGDVWEFLTNSFIPLSKRDKLLAITPTCMPHALPSDSPYLMTLGHQIDLMDDAFRNYFKKHPEIKTIGLISWDNAWGLGYANKIKQISKELNIKIVDEVKTLDWNGDFKTETMKILRHKPDLIFVTYLAERIARKTNEMQSKVKILTTLNIIESLLDPASNKKNLEGIYFVDFSPSAEYQQKFAARYKENPQYESHLSYEALMSVSKAIKNNPDDLLAGIKKVKYQGQAGEINFIDSNNANQAKASLFEIRDGKVWLVPPTK